MLSETKTMGDNRLCMRLKHLRRSRRLTLSAMQETTGIALHHLYALEECRYEILPEGAVRRSIVKHYLAALSEDTKIVEQYHDEIHTAPTVHTTGETKKRNFSFSFTRSAIVGIIGMILMLYLGFEVHAMIAAPPLELFTPANTTTTSISSITINGRTAPETIVTINGMNVAVRKDGSFTEVVNLKNGINDLVISAISKRGSSTKLTRRVVLN